MENKRKVLIVEDETLTALALASHMEEHGYSVLELSATGEDPDHSRGERRFITAYRWQVGCSRCTYGSRRSCPHHQRKGRGGGGKAHL